VYLRPDGTRWIFVSYLALLVWAPVPLGSNRSWAWALLALWVLALALWWLAGFIRGKYPYPSVLREAWPMLLCGLLWLGYVWLQLLPLPVEFLACSRRRRPGGTSRQPHPPWWSRHR